MALLDGLRTLDQFPLENQRVLVRADLDCEIENGVLKDDAPILRALPTIQRVQRGGARVVIAARLGEPGGRVTPALSLEPVAAKLSELLQCDVYLPDECVGEAARKVVQDLRPSQVCLLENLDFSPEEQKAEDAFARELARFGDVYVNDSIIDSNTRRTSIELLPKLLRERFMGYALAAELTAIARATEQPQRPLALVAGGSDAVQGLEWLTPLVDRANILIAGGAVGRTLLAAQGISAATVSDPGALARARTLLTLARDRKVKLVLPTDVVIAESVDALAGRVVSAKAIPVGALTLDVGPETRAAFASAVASAKTVLWNGALGAAENPAFSQGTLEFAQALSDSPGFGLVLGSGTVRALRRADAELLTKIGFVSAGGRTALDLVEGRRLPGIEALRGGAT